MAMILDAFAGRCLELLGQLIEEKAVMILGVKDDLRRLQEKLEMIKDVLYDAERRRIEDAATNRWLSKLKDVMYDTDDIIDLCRIKGSELLQGDGESSSSAKRRRFSLLSYFTAATTCPVRHEIGKQIQDLNQRLEEISKDRQMFSLPQTSSPSVVVTQVNPRQTSPLLTPDFVGMRAKLAAEGLVESLLKSQGGSLLVIAIVGLGGIGKTTLAQKIYNHQKVRAHFQKRIWVCVSQNYSETGLLKEIIRSAGGNYGREETQAELQPLVSSVLAGSRLLLVLDDVWRADVWLDLLQIPLDHGVASGSRVVITTRNENVAKSMRATQIHQVQKLSADDGWALLCKTVFEDGADDDMQELHDIGMQIVKKCDGLPLTIRAIGGVLRTKDRSKSEWEKLYRSDAWSVRGELPEDVRGALYLSYEDLPSQLKQCFLYCSLLVEDQKLWRPLFVKLWVAEGFVTAQENSLAEDIAEDYYNDLIRRSLLHLNSYVLNGTACTIHDLTRSLALSLTRDESHIVDGNDSTTANSLKLPFTQKKLSKIRRLAIYNINETETVLNTMENSDGLRTLRMVKCFRINEQGLFQRFTHLRVLDLSDSMIESIPESIRNLQHLRYLDLRNTEVRHLPESLGCLVNLQFLSLPGCKFLHTLPKTITQLCNLRSLVLYDTPLSHLPTGIGKLDNLNNLDGFVVGEDNNNDHESGTCQHGCGLDELQSISRLRTLSIIRLERVLTGGIQPLNNKPYLKELSLKWSTDVDWSLISEGKEEILEDLSPSPSLEVLSVENFCGLKFPLWISMLPNLTFLRLFNCLSCRHLPPLGQLPQLRTLNIDCAPAVVSIGPEFLGCDTEDGPGHRRTPTAFPKLEKLVIMGMSNWEEWICDAEEVDGGRKTKTSKLLPRLQFLKIAYCPKLRGLPDGLQHAAALKKCNIFRADSIREIKNILSLEELVVNNSQCLERISNLPALREMEIYDSCRVLKHVEKLDMLQSLSLRLEQEWTECLPEWLLGLVHEARANGTLQTFSLYCGEALRGRCIEGGQYWPLLCHIPHISVIHRVGYF